MTVAISLAHYLYYFNAIASSLSAGGHNANTRVEVLKPTPVLLEVDLPQCFYTSTTTSAFTPLPLPTPTSTRPRVFLPELDEEINTTPVFSFTPTTFFGLSFSTSAKLETCSSLVLEREINGNQKWDDAFAISTLLVVLSAFIVLILQVAALKNVFQRLLIF